VPVAANDDIVCTITNTRKQVTIKVGKELIPDTDTSKWDLTIDAAAPPNFPAAGAGDGFRSDTVSVFVGTSHSFGETAHTGTNGDNYTSAWECTDSDAAVVGSGTGRTITDLAIGSKNVTCVFTNRLLPKLKLVKEVINDNGGLKLPKDWTLTATGATAGHNFNDLGDSVTFHPVFGGVQYTLTESVVAGYSTTGIWVCVDVNGGTFTTPNKITLAYGTNVTCTITNNDIPGKITIIKKTDPQGAPDAFSFKYVYEDQTTHQLVEGTFTLTGQQGSNSKSFLQTTIVTITEVTDANGKVIVIENGQGVPSEWRLDRIQCSGGGVTINGTTVTFTVGGSQEITCTFRNSLPRMTGGGSVFQTAGNATASAPTGTRFTHGFELHCGVIDWKKRSNNLEVNWLGNAFHMNNLLSASCNGAATQVPKNAGDGDPDMPNAPFNRYIGSGTGGINKGKPAEYYARWVLTDHGEPGTNDTFSLIIWNIKDLPGGKVPTGPTVVITTTPLVKFGFDSNGIPILHSDTLPILVPNSGLSIQEGNHQAH
jgi:hypothetical protein